MEPTSTELGLERKLLALQQAQARVVEGARLSALGRMAGGLAHELNTPLSVVCSTAEFLLEKLKSDDLPRETLMECLGRSLKAAESAANVVRHFLLFSRDSTVTKERTDLFDVVNGALLMLSERIRIRGIELRRDLARHVWFWGAGRRIEQVVVNLIGNAVDAMAEVREKRMSLRCFREGDAAVLQVRDTGCGIAPEHRERLFTPFYSTKPEGTGLGLFVSYGIVKEHDGTITVRDAVNRGTIVEVRLPFSLESPSD